MSKNLPELCCGTCRFYEPHRDEHTHRIRPSILGNCTWRIPWPKVWPVAFRDSSQWLGSYPIHPRPFGVYAHSGRNCPTWEPATPIKATAESQLTLNPEEQCHAGQ